MSDDHTTGTSDSPGTSDHEETVRRNGEESRFEVHVGEELAGFSMYKDLPDDGQRIFYHTEIVDAFGGRGLASTLTRSALETSAAEGWRIVPVCPYVKKWLESHHEVDDAVDAVRPAHLEALR